MIKFFQRLFGRSVLVKRDAKIRWTVVDGIAWAVLIAQNVVVAKVMTILDDAIINEAFQNNSLEFRKGMLAARNLILGLQAAQTKLSGRDAEAEDIKDHGIDSLPRM